jgi:Flp pilus assembly protein TadB
MPAPDEIDRDKFYTPEADDDGEEYELEGPDPEVLAAEQRRRSEELAAVERSIDIDEIYRDEEHSRSSEILHEWVRQFRGGMRFQVKHLLVATAVVAIALTLWRLGRLFDTLVIGVMFGIIGVYLYLQWKEKQHQDEAAARRREIYARRRAAQHAAGVGTTAQPVAQPLPPPPADDLDRIWEKASQEQGFRFQFSLAQLMLTMMGAAVALGVVSILGLENASTVLGLVALVGLVAHAVGFQPPPILALGWWLLLVFYVLLSFVAIIWGAM